MHHESNRRVSGRVLCPVVESWVGPFNTPPIDFEHPISNSFVDSRLPPPPPAPSVFAENRKAQNLDPQPQDVNPNPPIPRTPDPKKP